MPRRCRHSAPFEPWESARRAASRRRGFGRFFSLSRSPPLNFHTAESLYNVIRSRAAGVSPSGFSTIPPRNPPSVSCVKFNRFIYNTLPHGIGILRARTYTILPYLPRASFCADRRGRSRYVRRQIVPLRIIYTCTPRTRRYARARGRARAVAAQISRYTRAQREHNFIGRTPATRQSQQ